MNKDLEVYISNAYPADQSKEPPISHDILSRPWETIASDLFELDGRDYLITVDYYSSFFEVDRLHSKTAAIVIGKLKPYLARHGIPDSCQKMGHPLTLRSLRFLRKSMDFSTSQVRQDFPNQINGKIENAVKTAIKFKKLPMSVCRPNLLMCQLLMSHTDRNT